jgi:hypothetical protein
MIHFRPQIAAPRLPNRHNLAALLINNLFALIMSQKGNSKISRQISHR